MARHARARRPAYPYLNPSQADLNKTKADIEEVLSLFKNFVAKNRPQVATKFLTSP